MKKYNQFVEDKLLIDLVSKIIEQIKEGKTVSTEDADKIQKVCDSLLVASKGYEETKKQLEVCVNSLNEHENFFKTMYSFMQDKVVDDIKQEVKDFDIDDYDYEIGRMIEDKIENADFDVEINSAYLNVKV